MKLILKDNPVNIALSIDTARMQGLWMREGMRGLCIGAAYWPLLLTIGGLLRPPH